MRKSARESILKLVFEYTFYEQKNDNTLAILLQDSSLEEDDRQFINNSYLGIIANEQDIKDTITTHLTGYTLDRLYRSDLVVLMLAVYELKFLDEPQAVIINEAVNLAKKYGTEKSGRFVNGVLAKIVKDC